MNPEKIALLIASTPGASTRRLVTECLLDKQVQGSAQTFAELVAEAAV